MALEDASGFVFGLLTGIVGTLAFVFLVAMSSANGKDRQR